MKTIHHYQGRYQSDLLSRLYILKNIRKQFAVIRFTEQSRYYLDIGQDDWCTLFGKRGLSTGSEIWFRYIPSIDKWEVAIAQVSLVRSKVEIYGKFGIDEDIVLPISRIEGWFPIGPSFGLGYPAPNDFTYQLSLTNDPPTQKMIILMNGKQISTIDNTITVTEASSFYNNPR